MAEPLVIGIAKPVHLSAILQLHRETHALHTDLQPVHFHKLGQNDPGPLEAVIRQQFHWLTRLKGSRRRTILVALRKGELVGYVYWVAHPTPGAVRRHRAFSILNIGVVKDARRTGIGRALLHVLAERASQQKASVINATVWSGNLSSAALFKECGYGTICESHSLVL
ncbi:GNAT family N-acetyltransferase [Halovulum sp. GXIMD14793]